jgi:predicted dehydrogenase
MGLEHRFVPASSYLRATLASGELGRVYHTRLWCGHVWRLPPSPHFLRSSLAGGGVIASTAVHWLDLALWILGNPEVSSVAAATFAKAPRLDVPPPPFQGVPDGARILAADDVEDFAAGFIRFADGSSLSFEANWLQHPTQRRIGIQFLAERGVAEHRPLAVRHDGDAQVVDQTPPDVPSEHAVHYFVDVVRDFVRAARSGGATIIRGSEMLQVQGIVDALYESARRQREISLSHA